MISTGVYGIVRHPLYFGCLLMMIGGPLLVGSAAGLLITALGTVGLVARILGEERMLRTEPAGGGPPARSSHGLSARAIKTPRSG